MNDLSHEQTEVAVTTLEAILQSRKMTQQQLANMSHVSQPTIANIINRHRTPSREQLTKLFDALGLKLESILDLDDQPERIFGYLATPLTGIVGDTKKEAVLKSVVSRIKDLAKEPEFSDPPFDIYWPGDYSHPVKNADLGAEAVYLMDRSRASTKDFVIMVCADPSFGVGQENEIATQAGVPVIRVVPPTLSRMMTGSFADAKDVVYRGTLATDVQFKTEDLMEHLRAVRLTYFHRRTLYKNLNGNAFGKRLERLVNDRTKGAAFFADDLGVSLSYVLALIKEPLAVSNPSTMLLKRIARRLDTRVAYLLGDGPETDPVWIESHEALRRFVTKTPEISADAYLAIRDEWRAEYRSHRDAMSILSNRAPQLMTEQLWDTRYRTHAKNKKKSNSGSPSLF
jgi:transcriptional regulator with XRE-family HTH domain